jgi:hypothetical protein
MATLRRSFLTFAVLSLCSSAFAGFPSTETILPAVGRVPGQGGAQFYTTVWATNLTGASVSFTFNFLKQGQANPNPAKFTDTLGAGETKVYENVVESKLGLANAIGAARITSTGEILVAERIFNQAPGADLGDTEGLFFAGVPKSFSISAGQSASIQGINQGGAENFRYNFALVETGGGSPTVNVQVFDGAGTLLGQKAYPLQPYEQLQPGVGEIVAGIHTTNARITATVTGGTGSVLLAGAQLANVSQDSSGFEMSFRDDILGSGGTAGVTSLNGLTGALTIAHGANTTVNVSGNTITIDAVAGSGTGLTAVAHDNSLAGSGTVALPLSVANGQVVRSLNGLHDNVTLAAGSNVTFTPSGQTLTIASQGLAVPFAGTGSVGGAGPVFWITNTAPGDALLGTATNGGRGVVGNGTYGILGIGTNAGVWGSSDSGDGIRGETSSMTGYGVYAKNTQGIALVATSDVSIGVSGNGAFAGVSGLSNKFGVEGSSDGDAGVYGVSSSTSFSSYGVFGEATHNGAGVYGKASNGSGVVGYTALASKNYGVFSDGNFGGTGAKFFVEPHPTDASKEIRYVALEGPESGTYFRGSSRTVNGFAKIEVPESFRMVTDENGLTVVATPVGELAVLACVKSSLESITIQSSKDVEFHYMVNGVRKAFRDHQPISENRDFIPRSRDDRRLLESLPEESVRRLKANGTLNEDGSINLEAARRLGWDRQESWKQAETRQ